MRVLIACLLVGACSSSPRRSGDSGAGSPGTGGGGGSVAPGVDAAPGTPIVDPPPGTPTPRLTGFPVDIDFGTVNIGAAPRTNAVVVTNIGDAPTRPLVATLNSGADIKLTSNCMGRVLRPEETCVVTAEFEPRMVGMSMASGSVGADGLTPINFMARGNGRVGPDAGPDVARPNVDAGAGASADVAVPRDVMAPGPDLARDVSLPRDLAPDVAPAADSRD